jgi:hypothetical protein
MERELWKILSAWITKLERRFLVQARTHQVGRIVRVYLWAALHDRPVSWACDRRNWVGVKPPRILPDQSTMSRRLRYEDTLLMLHQLAPRLSGEGHDSLMRYLDGKPLVVSRHSIDRDAKHGRGAGGRDRGYKLHAIYAENNRPIAWDVTPLNQRESQAAKPLIDRGLPPGYLLADAAYDANHLYDQAGERGVCLLTPRCRPQSQGVGHRVNSPHRLDALDRLEAPSSFTRETMKLRRRVETRFAHLTNFGGGLTCLPPWVRRLYRVRQWVAAKILIRLARDQHLRATAA